MKRFLAMLMIFAFVSFSAFGVASAEPSDDWASAPLITKAYEQAIGKIYIEWEGNAPVYQIYVDGKKVADVIVNHHIINVEKGTHSVFIYPMNEIREADTKVDINVDAKVIGAGVSIDLASLGLDPKRLAAGDPSEKFSFDYKPSQIMNGKPDNLSADTDPDNRVMLSFADQYAADEYLLTIKHRNDINYLTYHANDENEAKLITKTNSMVSLVLEPSFLQEQECIIPELNEEYRFTVQLRKYGTNLITGEKEKNVIHESKVSGEFTYRVAAAWKTAPVITFASQSDDGKITLQWDHEDYGAGCEYAVMKIKKVLGVKTGEEEWGRTTDHEFTMIDLNNGSYCINIIPILKDEKGTCSADANIDIKNEWVTAPELNCEQISSNQVKLTWKAPANIESYHIIISTGDNSSLLRFVNLDYSKYTELDVDAAAGEMEYIFTYDEDIDTENGVKMKFEVYGVRHTSSGEEQKSATSAKTIVVK